ncbi:MAG: hypothetical protein CMJ18_12455 [Phycisphaeraceae bacterium]|nr:hypothetical protein [Phycisphaeraceae bacterium]
MTEPIRVGMIRCDLHAAYYAALIDKHDPLLLRQPMPLDQSSNSWHRGGAHFYHYMYYGDPRKMTVEAVDGFQIVRVWDRNRADAEVLSRIFDGRPKVCDDFEQVSDGVDLVLIADCDGDGSDHVTLAAPGLEKGVPTFVDKPLAYCAADARHLLDLARRRDTLLYSMSILGALPAAAVFRDRLPEVEDLQFGNVQGGGTAMAGHIHAVLLALNVFGRGVRSVRCMGDDPLQLMQLSYGDQAGRPPHGVTISSNIGAVWHSAFYVGAYGSRGSIHSRPLNDFDFPFGAAKIMRDVKQMLKRGTVPGDLDMMIEGVAICEAARIAQRTGESVEVAAVMNGDVSDAAPQGRS